MPKQSKPKKIKKIKVSEGVPPVSNRDTSRDTTTRGSLIASSVGGKELKIDQELNKKKQIKEKDVFDFNPKK
tara:strand:- start:433 stop:648 length:216 start_codon:yes stop_codon:yes gene_type:complete